MDISTFSKDHSDLNSPYFKVIHTQTIKTQQLSPSTPSPYEVKILKERDTTLELEKELLEYYEEDDSEDTLLPDIMQGSLISFTQYTTDEYMENMDLKNDNLYTASFSWAQRLHLILVNLYSSKPFHTTDVFRALINCTLVPSKIAQGGPYDTDDSFDLHTMLGYLLLSIIFLTRSMESLTAVLARAHLLKKQEYHILAHLNEQAQSLKEELAERIFLIHCKISQAS